MHDVYTQAGTVAAYRAAGAFPDGAVLVKEIRSVERAPLTSGQASWAGRRLQTFVMVKDAEGRHAGSSLWGDGWLWALHESDAPQVNVAKSYAADCQGCHVPAAATEHVFVQGYPTLAE